MIPSLRELERAGCVGPTDVALAETLTRLGGVEGETEIELAVALARRLISVGHVCLDLVAPPHAGELRPEGHGIGQAEDELDAWTWPEAEQWQEALRATSLVGGAESIGDGSTIERRPLVLDAAGRLYLRRYYEHEYALSQALRERADSLVDVDESSLAEGLDRLFGPLDPAGGAGPSTAGQRRAVEAAMRRRLCVVSGGPGTGKTSTVARLLVLAVEQARATGRPDPQILLVAPTGKAAAALTAAISKNLEGLDCDDRVRDVIPREASTIHRALGSRGGVGAGFRHGLDESFAADLVVVDEASMVDLSLMRHLVDAIPSSATLVMMGDADQLASVEAGAVLADVCNAGRSGELAMRGPLAPAIARLEHSYRFSADSGIGALARAVNHGEVEAAFDVLLDEGLADAIWVDRVEGGWPEPVAQCLDAGYRPLFDAETPGEGLAAMARFRVLCPHRVGPLGVDDFNVRLAARGRGEMRSGSSSSSSSSSSSGVVFEPILIERNDHALGLFNGDMGLRVVEPGARAVSRVHFAGRAEPGAREEPTRELSELRLPPHSPCWAMSVHKSQGSEFDEVLVVLPERSSPLLVREMLYTAITRARERVVIWGPREVLAQAIERRVERRSGLRDALWS